MAGQGGLAPAQGAHVLGWEDAQHLMQMMEALAAGQTQLQTPPSFEAWKETFPPRVPMQSRGISLLPSVVSRHLTHLVPT